MQELLHIPLKTENCWNVWGLKSDKSWRYRNYFPWTCLQTRRWKENLSHCGSRNTTALLSPVSFTQAYSYSPIKFKNLNTKSWNGILIIHIKSYFHAFNSHLEQWISGIHYARRHRNVSLQSGCVSFILIHVEFGMPISVLWRFIFTERSYPISVCLELSFLFQSACLS